jgi:hypothetical protein
MPDRLTLGFDLGRRLAWALVLDWQLLDHGCFYLASPGPGPPRDAIRRRTLGDECRLCEQAAGYVRNLLAEKRPAVVALEKPQVPTWLTTGAELRRKARDTEWLWLLGWYIAREAGAAGAELAVVTAQEGFAALTGSVSGDKVAHVRLANLRFGLKLRAGEHHVADAIGVALAGEAREGHQELLRRLGAY